MKWLRAVAVLAVSGAVVLAPLPAGASHTWNGMHWQRGGTGTAGQLTINGYRYVGVHNGMDQSETVQAKVNAATARWNDPNWYAVHLIPANFDSSYPWPCDWTPPPDGWGVSLCYGTPSDPDALAQTQMMRFDGHMLWVRIIVRPTVSASALTTVLTHELGHALGLAHNTAEQASVMWPSAGGTTGWPTSHDRDTVASLYNFHLH